MCNVFGFADVNYDSHDHAPRKVRSVGMSETSTML